MLKRLLNFKVICLLLVSCFWLNSMAHAQDFMSDENFYPDKTKLVMQQIDLLKIRLAQAKTELQTLKKQDAIALNSDHVNKQLFDESGLDIAVAKSNLDSINIELTECQQAASRLEKDTQELQNQLNVFNIFGVKIARNGSPDLSYLREELSSQLELFKLEKIRVEYLQQLQNYADSMLQLYKIRHVRIESILKSQTIL